MPLRLGADLLGEVLRTLRPGDVVRLAKASPQLRRAILFDDTSWAGGYAPARVAVVDGRATLHDQERRCCECWTPKAEWEVWAHEPVGSGTQQVRDPSMPFLCQACVGDVHGFRRMMNSSAVQRECMAAGKKHRLSGIRRRGRKYSLVTPNSFRNQHFMMLGREVKRLVAGAQSGP